MGDVPDRELYDLVRRHQDGDETAGWQFVQHRKIQAIIRGRIKQYRLMFAWLPAEDMEDVECGLWPVLIDLIGKFNLPDQPNDGRVLSYFTLRIRGEADFLLKKITGMKQVTDEKEGKTYLKSLSQTLDGLEEMLPGEDNLDGRVVDGLEHSRQDGVLETLLGELPDWSNDRIWLRCHILRLKGRTWAEIARDIGYKQTDYTWLKDNTARFVTRLKHKLILMGESVNYRICGIYTDASIVAICVHDPSDKRNNIIWSKDYDSYADLDRVEAKLGDLFRQHHISYVVLNEELSLSMAHAIIMRYLVKREGFVETVDLGAFSNLLPRMPDVVGGVACTDEHRRAILLSHIKRAHLDESVRRRKRAAAT